jgi:penicillin-binding protein 1B
MDRATHSRGKSRPRAAKRGRKSRRLKLLAAILLPPAIVLAAFLIRYYYLFDAIIQEKLRARAAGAVTEIYAAPAVLFPGKPAALDQLCAEARRLGYVERGARNGAAWYEVKDKDRLVIHNDDLPIEFAHRSVEVAFSGGRIRQLVDPDTRVALEMFGLKPQLLSNFITGEREKRRFVPYAELPPVLINAVLAAEDRRFFTHAGVDPVRIIKALIVDIRQGEAVQGASTLTQQFVKNYFLTPERTLKRKLTDAYMSILLERRLSKQEIFELWANEVYLGQHGSFSIAGFGEAAKAFFNKSVKDLTLEEAATLAGIIPAPNRYAPLRHPERARTRRDQVLDAMAEYGMISAAECQRAKAAPLATKPATALNYSDAPYFVDYVQEYLDERLGPDNELARAHYKVHTTLDVALQQAAYEALREGLAEVDEILARGPRGIEPGTVQASLIAVDPVTGRILAMVGGRNYGASQFNRITHSKRQPGSIFKPIVYAAALETAYTSASPLTPVSSVLDAPARFAFDNLLYEPRNYKEEYFGQVSMRQAVAHSLNIATIRFAEAVGFDKITELARRLGLNEDIQPYPAMAIGAFEVTPLEMVRAYTAFAAGGMLAELLPVDCVMDAAGRPIFRAEPQRAQVISPQVAFMVTSLLQSVIREGTGAGVRARGFALPAAGKTGSSHDGWFAGYTPELLCVAWVGFDDNRELNLPGSRSALPIWTAFMKRAAALRRLSGKEFEVPEDIVSVEVDPTTGYLATERCLYRQSEYFIKGTEPVLPCYGNSYGHTIAGAPASIYSNPHPNKPGPR